MALDPPITLRYLDADLCDGDMQCLHCGELFEDWGIVDTPLHELELDAEGFNCDWPDLGHETTECPYCNKLLVFGCSGPDFIPYYVKGRSLTDIRYLKQMGKLP